MDDLFNKYMPKAAGAEDTSAGGAVDPLFEKYGLKGSAKPNTSTLNASTGSLGSSTVDQLGEGALKGVKNVAFTANKALLYIDKALGNEGAEGRISRFDDYVKSQNEEFKKNPSIAKDIGEIGGEIAATAPLIPAKLLQGANVLFRAGPTILASGEKIAAPIVNRIAALGGQGAITGTEFNALTKSARPDKSLPVDLAEGLATGAVGGPIAHGAVNATSRVLTGVKNLWANIQISRLANGTGIDASAAKRIINRLEEAGYSPSDASAALTKMGPKATLADLDQSLTTEASGLASFGGKPTSLLKGTFEDRAATANSSANQIIENRLGAKPDIQAEREKVMDEARQLAGPDYKIAHASTTPVDVSGVVSNIDKSLETAVGSKQAELAKAKGYLFKQTKDAAGNTVSTLKNDVVSLHEVRQALDDTLGRLPTEGSSQKSSTYRAISQVRDEVDKQLKTIKEMASADAVYAEKANIKKGLDYGYQSLTKGTKEEFEKIWNAASTNPEIQAKIRLGLRTAIGDAMEAAQRGELAGAQRLFGKKSVNREKLKMAFGGDADLVLDELAKEASFRATENAVRSGSQTAERLAVQKAYGKGAFEGAGGVLSEAGKGLAVDIATGSGGGASAIMAARKIASGAKERMIEVRANNMSEGAADLLSRQGLMRDSALDSLSKVKKFQDRKITTAREIRSKLPVVSGAAVIDEPLAQYLREKYKNF